MPHTTLNAVAMKESHPSTSRYSKVEPIPLLRLVTKSAKLCVASDRHCEFVPPNRPLDRQLVGAHCPQLASMARSPNCTVSVVVAKPETPGENTHNTHLSRTRMGYSVKLMMRLNIRLPSDCSLATVTACADDSCDDI